MTQRLLNDQVVGQVQEAFGQLKEPVEVLFFGKKNDCEYCDDTQQLLQEITDISDKLTLQIYDIDDHADLARQYKVDKAPGTVIAGRDGDKIIDYGVRLAGIPSGHEFSSLVHDMVLVSSRDSGLGVKTRQALAKLTQPVLLQVFVTPT
jgi:glutaredoxin-like protein